MSYQITWSEGTNERLRAGLVFLNPSDRREWLIDRIVEHVEKKIAAYPQDAAAKPKQFVTGELHVGKCSVRYEIHMDTHEAVITGIEPYTKPKAS